MPFMRMLYSRVNFARKTKIKKEKEKLHGYNSYLYYRRTMSTRLFAAFASCIMERICINVNFMLLYTHDTALCIIFLKFLRGRELRNITYAIMTLRCDSIISG